MKSFAAILGASEAPVPDQTGDGSKIAPEEDTSLFTKAERTIRDMYHLGIENVQTLLQMQKEKMTGELTDDKTYLMEGLIRTAVALPEGSKTKEAITNKFVAQLWNDLEHPPQSYLGTKYQYRSADGSNNNTILPELGAAGTAYARTVKPSMMQTPSRPDPGVVFDSVMTRKHAELHPNRISSMLFYLASIIIHDLFRTSHEDSSISLTSSYLDLSPLYGSNQAEQDKMRTGMDGKIKPDCFSEARLLFFPPGVGALLIMFNRFHNYTVENLALINENNRFEKPAVDAPKVTSNEVSGKAVKDKWDASKKKYDEDLFQTGRLITCGLYVNIILIDYVRTILDLNRTDSNWQLNPRLEVDDLPMGIGNQVSAEFNLVYRWHSTVSDRDERWTQDMWDGLFGKGRDPKTVGKYEFLGRLSEVSRKTDPDPSKRKFAGLERRQDGTLPDDSLVDILVSGIEDCANSFGPNRVPAVFRAIEVLGIEQARSWNLGSLNEFRKYFKLEPHRTFESITQDKYVQEQLKHLYDLPDKVEVYPGIVVEDAKQPMAPGSGLTPPYTISRAVLSDAVALVRGDRFYTKDYNPRTLTNWGYRSVEYDTDIDNGCVFYKLFLHAFPNHFKQNSVYAHYPLTIPSAMQEVLKDLKKDKLYDFAKPAFTSSPYVVKDYNLAMAILKERNTFKVTWNTAHFSGAPSTTASQDIMSSALYPTDTPWYSEIRAFYTAKTRQLLALKSAHIADFRQIDIIRDVGNLASLHFAVELFMLPLKSSEKPHGVFTEAELYSMMIALMSADKDPASAVLRRGKARKSIQVLGDLVAKNVEKLGKAGSVVHGVFGGKNEDTELKSYGMHLIQRLLQHRSDPKELAFGYLLPTAAAMVTLQGALFAQVLEYYLLGNGNSHWAEIVRLANNNGEDAQELLMRYVMEGIRLNGETSVLRRVDMNTSIGSTLNLKAGDTIFLDIRTASHDPSTFPFPNAVDLTRPMELYTHDAYQHLPILQISLTTMLREVARLKNLRPALGPQGKVHKVVRKMGSDVEGKYAYHAFLSENQDMYSSVPRSEFKTLKCMRAICANGMRRFEGMLG